MGRFKVTVTTRAAAEAPRSAALQTVCTLGPALVRAHSAPADPGKAQADTRRPLDAAVSPLDDR